MRNRRMEKMFNTWLEEERYERLLQTFSSFKARCDAGEIEGFDGRVSDTVSVDAEASPASEKRDELPETKTESQATPTKRPGPSESRDSSSPHTNEGAVVTAPEQRTG